MNDQNTPLVHKCNDEVAHVRIDQLQRQRQEDRQELTTQMKATNDGIKGIGGKLDKMLDTQTDHGTQIALLTAKGTQGWGAIPQWAKVLIYMAAAAAGGGGGLAALNNLPAETTAQAPTEADR